MTSGVYRGRPGVQDWWERFLEAWESLAVEIDETTDGPDGSVRGEPA